jgi:hypothetical protein
MGSLQDYFEKSIDELKKCLSKVENERSYWNSAEQNACTTKEINRITYTILSKQNSPIESLKRIKQHLERELADEIKELKFASVTDEPKEFDNFEEKPEESNRRPKGGKFIKIMFDILDDREWLKKNRNKTALYLVMRRYICRAPMQNDRFDIYNRYYRANRLACCLSEEHLAHLFGYNTRSQVQRMLKKLEKEGAFIVEKIPQKKPLKPKNIYILGEFQAGEEVYYYK